MSALDFLPYAESFYETTLAQAITASSNTMIVSQAPTQTSGYLVLEPNSSNREIVKFTNVSGVTLTIVRGLSESNAVDDSAGTGTAHAAGVQVAMKDVHYYLNKVVASFRGDYATGFNTFRIGDGNAVSATNRLWYAHTTTASAFWGLSSNGRMVVSEDGINSYVISAGGSGLVGGDGTVITAGAIGINSLSTGGLEISASKLAVDIANTTLYRSSAGIGLSSLGSIGTIENLSGTTAATLSSIFSSVSASVTATNLADLTDTGSTILHYHPVAGGVGGFSSVGISNFTHSLGRTPKYIKVVTVNQVQTNTTAHCDVTYINGSYYGVTQNDDSSGGANASYQVTDAIFKLYDSAGSSIVTSGLIQNVTSASFQISCTKYGSSTNGFYYWMAEA